jgi:hypothetical protein
MEQRITEDYYNTATKKAESAEYLPSEINGFYKTEINGKLKQLNLLVENHGSLKSEIEAMKKWINIIVKIFYKIDQGKKYDINIIQNRLDIKLPEEINVFYKYVGNYKELLTGTEEGIILSPENLYIQDGNIIFYKHKKTVLSISLDKRQILVYNKKQWYYEKEQWSFCKFITIQLLTNALNKMPCKIIGKSKKSSMISLEARKNIAKKLTGILTKWDYFYDHTFILFYNIGGDLAIFMSNGFNSKLEIGSYNEKTIEKIKEVDLEIEYE